MLFHNIPLENDFRTTVQKTLQKIRQKHEADGLSYPFALVMLQSDEKDYNWLKEWWENHAPKVDQLNDILKKEYDRKSYSKNSSFQPIEDFIGKKPILWYPSHWVGLMFFLLTYEWTRRHASSDNIWKRFFNDYIEIKLHLHPLGENNPTKHLYIAMETAARHLGVHHHLDNEIRSQKYVNTIKFQWGIPFAEIRQDPRYTGKTIYKRLTESQNELKSIEYLKTHSPYFRQFWQILKQYINGTISRKEIEFQLQNTQWVPPRLHEDLLQQLIAEKFFGRVRFTLIPDQEGKNRISFQIDLQPQVKCLENLYSPQRRMHTIKLRYLTQDLLHNENNQSLEIELAKYYLQKDSFKPDKRKTSINFCDFPGLNGKAELALYDEDNLEVSGRVGQHQEFPYPLDLWDPEAQIHLFDYRGFPISLSSDLETDQPYLLWVDTEIAKSSKKQIKALGDSCQTIRLDKFSKHTQTGKKLYKFKLKEASDFALCDSDENVIWKPNISSVNGFDCNEFELTVRRFKEKKLSILSHDETIQLENLTDYRLVVPENELYLNPSEYEIISVEIVRQFRMSLPKHTPLNWEFINHESLNSFVSVEIQPLALPFKCQLRFKIKHKESKKIFSKLSKPLNETTLTRFNGLAIFHDTYPDKVLLPSSNTVFSYRSFDKLTREHQVYLFGGSHGDSISLKIEAFPMAKLQVSEYRNNISKWLRENWINLKYKEKILCTGKISIHIHTKENQNMKHTLVKTLVNFGQCENIEYCDQKLILHYDSQEIAKEIIEYWEDGQKEVIHLEQNNVDILNGKWEINHSKPIEQFTHQRIGLEKNWIIISRFFNYNAILSLQRQFKRIIPCLFIDTLNYKILKFYKFHAGQVKVFIKEKQVFPWDNLYIQESPTLKVHWVQPEGQTYRLIDSNEIEYNEQLRLFIPIKTIFPKTNLTVNEIISHVSLEDMSTPNHRSIACVKFKFAKIQNQKEHLQGLILEDFIPSLSKKNALTIHLKDENLNELRIYKTTLPPLNYHSIDSILIKGKSNFKSLNEREWISLFEISQCFESKITEIIIPEIHQNKFCSINLIVSGRQFLLYKPFPDQFQVCKIKNQEKFSQYLKSLRNFIILGSLKIKIVFDNLKSNQNESIEYTLAKEIRNYQLATSVLQTDQGIEFILPTQPTAQLSFIYWHKDKRYSIKLKEETNLNIENKKYTVKLNKTIQQAYLSKGSNYKNQKIVAIFYRENEILALKNNLKIDSEKPFLRVNDYFYKNLRSINLTLIGLKELSKSHYNEWTYYSIDESNLIIDLINGLENSVNKANILKGLKFAYSKLPWSYKKHLPDLSLLIFLVNNKIYYENFPNELLSENRLQSLLSLFKEDSQNKIYHFQFEKHKGKGDESLTLVLDGKQSFNLSRVKIDITQEFIEILEQVNQTNKGSNLYLQYKWKEKKYTDRYNRVNLKLKDWSLKHLDNWSPDRVEITKYYLIT